MPPITKVFEENTFSGAYGPDGLDGTGTVTVEHDAFIIASGDNGLEFEGGPWKIKVDGYVESNLNGMALYDPTTIVGNSSITVGTEGTIINTGAGYSGISTAMALDVVNSGLIMGTDNGIKYSDIFHSSSKAISITNNAGGEIHGSQYGIYLEDSNHDLILKNAGIIDEVWWGRGSTITNSGTIEELYEYSSTLAYNNTITNTGKITQGVGTGHGNDVLTNSGTIGHAVSLNNGNNTITNKGFIGHVGPDGSIYTNEGNDTLTNTGTIDSFVMLGDGINKVTNGGTIGGYLELGSGNDTVGNTGLINGKIDFVGGKDALTNSGTIRSDITFGSDNDTATNSGAIVGFVILGSGDDKFTNSGDVSSYVSLGGGTNTLVNSGHIHGEVFNGKVGNATITNTGIIDGTFTITFGDLNFTNSGTMGGDIHLGMGTHKLTNSGTIAGELTSSAGSDDTLTNTKLIGGNIDLSDGTNIFTNGGTVSGSVTGTSGNDTFTNSKLIVGVVDLGEGDNKVTNSGIINQAEDSGGLTTGGGNDVIVSTGQVFGSIDLGSGNDKFSGGNFTDLLTDGFGNDVYNLGGGNDHIHWIGQGNDTVDGGAGVDQFSAEGASEGVQINLDTKAVGFLAYHLAASSAVTSTSTTTVKNFEYVWGSQYGDAIAGSSGNDTLLGLDGPDALYGGKGADDIYAGGGDGATDGIIYLAITDSGNTKATRDTISGFEGAGVSGGDRIILTNIDANTKTAGVNDGFHLMSVGDVAFDLTPGCLRWVHEKGTTDMTIIQGDVNGDGKADFSIAVVGTVNFVDGDFSL